MNNPLLLEIQRFAVGKNAYHRDEPPDSEKKAKNIFRYFHSFLLLISATLILVRKSLKLLEELPVLRDSIFDYYSMIFEVSIANYIKMEVKVGRAK